MAMSALYCIPKQASGATNILGATLPGTLTTLLLAGHSVNHSWGGTADVGGDAVNFSSQITGMRGAVD